MLRDSLFGGRKTSSFTLQWHLTNECENSCKHCYDRTDRTSLSLATNKQILTDLLSFSKRNAILPRVTLSGGNPLLYPHFWELYEEIAYRGVSVSLLSNPCSRETLARLCAIRKPDYYQVSLEGLRETNDEIRGAGTFDRTIQFIQTAKEFGVPITVMMTISESNLNEVIPLAKLLSGTINRFSFNRLSSVGEGTQLTPVSSGSYERFLREYYESRTTISGLSLKENLFNIIREENGEPLTGGCTGFGCGAAFNFLALLPDGEIHACRKFPSPIGSILTTNIHSLYTSKSAGIYRKLPRECKKCSLKSNCGSCLAVTYGEGKDISQSKDVCCFRK